MASSLFIQKMFDDISFKYDLLNDLLSFFTHRLWKKRLVSFVMENAPSSVLDCATGTGDIAFMLKKKNISHVEGIDFSGQMIKLAQEKSKKINLEVDFSTADIMSLPHKDRSFECVTIAFGIRNVEFLERGLSEISRVSSQSVAILEFGQPQSKIVSFFYFNILRLYMPLLGALTKRKDAYEYLIDSSMAFPSGEKFIKIAMKNGQFSQGRFLPLFGGIAYIYLLSKDEV